MDQSINGRRPSLLMVSHCVPDAVGGMDRARAWQLLRLAAATHTVHLVCLLDEPVNLAQWRTVNDRVDHFAIETSRTGRGTTRRWIGLGRRPVRKTGLNDTPLSQWIDRWSQRQSFDVLLCTHPMLWPATRSVPTRQRICDLNTHRRHTQQRWRHGRFHHEQLIAGKVDLLTLGRPGDGRGLTASDCQTLVLPNRIDPDFFTRVRVSQLTRRYARPGVSLVIHSQWRSRTAERVLAWFVRRVWPAVKQAVPEAQLRSTRPGVSDPFTTLFDASVVVCPDADPDRAHLPVLQALAMQRAVTASTHAVEPLNQGIRHGEHLLLSDKEHDWIESCVELLRSASARLRLSHNAHRWIDHYTPIEQAGSGLIKVLSCDDPTLGRINRAA